MKKRIIGLFLAATLLIATCGIAVAAQYAVAVSSSKLYQVRVSGSSMSYKKIFDLGDSSWARSIATYGNKILVTEVGSGGSSLRAFTLAGGGVTEEASISMSGISYANSVAVDSNGGIYVTDGSSTSSAYAYMSSLSDTAHVRTIGTGYAPLMDVATSDNSAVIISKHRNDVDDQSNITTLAGGSVGTTISLQSGTNYPRYPVAVAAKSGYAYVVSEVYNNVGTNSAALSRYSISANTVDTPTQLAGFVPTDIITYTSGPIDYLAMIGRTTSGTLQARRTMLIDGAITTWTTKDLGTDGGVDFQCAASADGSLLWYSSAGGEYVGATSWTNSLATGTGDDISGLVAFTTEMTPVPEPSSLLALASFGVGAFGFLIKRKGA
ncbi:MAG: PEP-CTERM sorting domain-containing protein [Armatimonadota bacterium]